MGLENSFNNLISDVQNQLDWLDAHPDSNGQQYYEMFEAIQGPMPSKRMRSTSAAGSTLPVT